jgi:hypothetical protein
VPQTCCVLRADACSRNSSGKWAVRRVCDCLRSESFANRVDVANCNMDSSCLLQSATRVAKGSIPFGGPFLWRARSARPPTR